MRFSLFLITFILLAGCAGIPKTSPPALQGIEVEELTDSEDPLEMARAAGIHCGYRSGLDRQLAAFKLAQRAYLEAPGNRLVDLTLARCSLSLAGLMEDEKLKVEVAQKGYEAASAAGGKKDPVSAYYYGACLGMLIEDKGIAAAGELDELEAALKKAAENADTDSGGPLRALGMLYLRAPPWPTGIGDLDRSLELLGRAARDFPRHPANHIYYSYALQEDGRSDEARRELSRAEEALREGEWGEYASGWEEEIAAFRKDIGER